MVNLYATLIINKRRTLQSVPKSLRDDVKARLTELGYNENGDPVSEEVAE